MNSCQISFYQKSAFFHWINYEQKLSKIQSFLHQSAQCSIKCQVPQFCNQLLSKTPQNIKQNLEVSLQLMKNTILVRQVVNSKIIDCLQCNRNTKFEVIYHTINNCSEPKGIKLSYNGDEDNNIFFKIDSSQINALKIFQQHLFRQNIVQGGFHQNFKAKRKLYQTQYHSIYRAQNLIDKKEYAIKSFQKDSYFGRLDVDGLAKFNHYFDTHINLMRIYHPSFVRFDGVFQTSNSIYIKLQVLGSQFKKYLKQNIFQKQQSENVSAEIVTVKILKLFLRIAEGITHLHQNNLAHRSLCIDSIMVRNNQNASSKELKHQPVIVDFNHMTSKSHDGEQQNKQKYVGAEGYTAPQILNAEIEDISLQNLFKADVYSLGCILCYMIMQKPPNQVQNLNQGIKDDKCNVYMQNSSKLGQKIENLIKKCLQNKPQERISSKELVQQIKKLLQEQIQKVPITSQLIQGNIDQAIINISSDNNKIHIHRPLEIQKENSEQMAMDGADILKKKVKKQSQTSIFKN